MADQNLTIVTAIIAGAFFLVQIVIFMICLSRISQVKNEELKPGLKLSLLDNEENLFDLGLYVGLGGTVLSLILLLVLDVKQDALIDAVYFHSFWNSFRCRIKNLCRTPLSKSFACQARW